MDKNNSRLRRAKKTRCKIKELCVPRLSVHRTPRHLYAQIIMPEGKVAAAVSTLSAEIKQELASSYSGNVISAKVVGKYIAKKAAQVGVTKVAFDRSGYKYHGRVQAFADAARENGLLF